MANRTKAALIVAGAAVVLAGAAVGAVEIFTPARATTDGSVTAPPATTFSPPPSIAITANEQGVVPLDDVSNLDERQFLAELENAGIKYPASYAALFAGRRAAPAVCGYYNAPSGQQDGSLIVRIVREAPEWAEGNRPGFSQAVLHTMCDGTQPRR